MGEEALYDLGYYLGDQGISYADIKNTDKTHLYVQVGKINLALITG
jgi:hypothetical protein